MNNDAVIQLVKAGLTDDLIVTTINASPGTYDVSTDGLIALKKASVSDRVVKAMVTKSMGKPADSEPIAPPPPPAPVAPAAEGAQVSESLPAGVDEVGVYLRSANGSYSLMTPEVVIFEESGKMMNIFSIGFAKRSRNGHIDGSRSRQDAPLPVTFGVYVPDGTAIADYVLYRLHPQGTGREFEATEGSFTHGDSATEKDVVPTTTRRVATKFYEVTVPASAGRGEFGLLVPNPKGSASSGRIYTISVAE